MEQNYTDDTFLSRWLNNNLTNEELVSFQKTNEYQQYVKIAEAMNAFEAPKFNQSAVLDSIKQKVGHKPKVRKLIPNWMYAAAASVALLFSVVYYMSNSSETYTTSFGEQLAITLPDGSEVQLNASSSLSYKKSDWFDGERTLTLDGEGYFKVNKGSKFSVHTENGNVSVLGTQFNVKTNPSYFEVRCYEGKVQVKSKEEIAILTQGLSFRKIDNKASENGTFNNPSPFWLQGESSFGNAPLKFVIKELELQYGVSISTNNIDVDTLFTGTFTNKNLTLALETICSPLSIQYTVEGKTVSLEQN